MLPRSSPSRLTRMPSPPWVSAPPKEGRRTTNAFTEQFSPNKRRTTLIRLLMIAAVLVTLHLFISGDHSSIDSPLSSSLGRRTDFRKGSKSNSQLPLQGASVPETTAPVEVAKPAPHGVETIEPEPERAATSVRKPSIPEKPKTKAVSASAPSKRDPVFERSLQRVLSLLPNELEMRGLLQPVKGTGKAKLREIGLRSRAYRNFLQAWEDLHFFEWNGQMQIRDDIITYMRQHPEFTNEVGGLGDAVRSYEAYRFFMMKMGNLLFPWTSPYFGSHASLHASFYSGGKGIVLTGGDGQAPYLLTSIQSFRKLGCTLPIEILYLGEADLSEEFREKLEALDGVVTRDIKPMVADRGWELRGWAAKPYAILLCSFREVIFIDADALFFKDPSVLFEEALYEETGTLFFKDRIIMPESKKNWMKEVLPAPISKQARQNRYWTGVSGHMQESGVVVVDKWQHLVALLLVARMNGSDRDGDKSKDIIGVYDMVYGDKETYWLGWELVGDLNYAFHEGDAGIIGALQTVVEKERKLKEKERKENKNKEKKDDKDGKSYDHSFGIETADIDPAEQNAAVSGPPYTICAPQLLHLDMDNKPLWFNGWILSNKFAEEKKLQATRFDVYIREPTIKREPDAWQLQEHNEACLTNDENYAFTDTERGTLEMIIELAKSVGAYGKK